MKKFKAVVSAALAAVIMVSCDAIPGEPWSEEDTASHISHTTEASQAPVTTEPKPTPPASTASPETEPPALTYASYSGSEAEGTLTYTTCRGDTITDFSFLDGLSRDFFSDTADTDHGSWYCGDLRRDPDTGEVTVVNERADDVLDALNRYGAVYRKNEDSPVIYLTFDCGYETGYTDEILDILREKEVTAAFFLNGYYIKTAPENVERMLDEGHVVGNHGNNHRVMSHLTLEEFFYEVESTNELLREAVPDAPYMEYFRPSYGSCSEWDLALAQKMDLKEVLYSWTYFDYDPESQMDPEAALDKAKRGLHNGCVLMLHTVGETNVQILGDLIDYARAEGFRIGDIRE